MATYSSILAWEIPWTEEPGGLVHGVTEWATTERLRNDNSTVMPFGQRRQSALQSLALQSQFSGDSSCNERAGK